MISDFGTGNVMGKYSHVILRTSPKGEAGVGFCAKCGRENLTYKELWTCDVPDSEDDVMVALTAESDA